MRQSDSRIERAAADLPGHRRGGGDCLFAALDLLAALRLPFPTLGPVVSTLYLFFLAQTLLRLRLMDLHELLGKIAAQTVLAVILALVFAVLTAWVQAQHARSSSSTRVVAAFVMLILLEPLRAKVEEQVVAIFFRERFELLALARARCARGIANVIDVARARARWCSTRSTRRGA